MYSNQTVPVSASNYQSLVYVKGMQKSEWVTVLGAIAKSCLGINAIGMAWLFTDSVLVSNLWSLHP